MLRKLFTLGCLLLLAGKISAQAIGDYQSAANGNWNALATWQTWNGSVWVAAVSTPTSANGVITIQAGHTVTITANVTIDEVVVNGTLTSSGATPTTINNGTNGSGIDLVINGTFIDNYAAATNVITWSAGSSWQMGASGTLIKTTASSSNNWQSFYQGGIANIPATSNWIIRRNTAVNISFSSTTPASGSVYPNLTIENNVAGTWSTPAASSITGATAFVTIKGNFDVGGTGTSTVDFLNNNTNASPTLVQGNVTIRTGNIVRNYGTGLEVRGNITVNGTVSYDAADARRIVFSGGNNQTVNGTGTFNIYDIIFNKSGGTVTLNRSITIDNLSTFTSGIVISSATNLYIVAASGTVTGANNTSFVSGPVRYLGSSAFTFPVGKNADYQAIAISGFTSGAFWTENFNNGCVQGCLANGYNGPNGTWTVSSTGTNDAAANLFFISCQENGNAVGACGSGCGSDATLHIGNQSTSPAAFFFCPTGDCGAAYDAGLGSNNVRASWRAESPTINCSAYSNIVFSFRYMENGSGTLDNATAWYFDGATWTQLADMAKTATTCVGQGLWTAYSISLPASANNNANVKVGFQWVNNDDGAGSDPSFAVDVVQLSTQDYFTAEYFYANPQVVYNNNLAPTLSSISGCEYWILDRSAGSTATTSVTLTWDGNSCPAIPQVSDTRVAHFDNTTWQDEGNGATTGTAAAGTVRSAAAVTYFSPFTIGLIPSVLPVELTGFSGECSGGPIVLHWNTASETNNSFFTVERSMDGQNFAPIGTIAGAGNSSQPHNYDFTDPAPSPGQNYYRLRQTDYNGQNSLSQIIAVTGCSDTHTLALVYALSSTEGIEISYNSGNGPVSLEIFAADGRLVYRSAAQGSTGISRIPLASSARGIYFIRISDGFTSISRSIVR